MKAKVIQFTISQNSEKILESFSKKYGTSKSNVVNRALEFLAGAYHKKIIISYELSDNALNVQVKRHEMELTSDEDESLTDEQFREKYLNR